MKTIEVTEKEEQIINEFRFTEKEKVKYNETKSKLLFMAYKYNEWLNKNKLVTSYSIFANEFIKYFADNNDGFELTVFVNPAYRTLVYGKITEILDISIIHTKWFDK